MTILIGADPEVFATKKGKHVSAHNMVPGTKESPHAVKDGAVQVDGMALEFNINPAGTENEFIYNMDSVLGQLKKMVPGYGLAADPVAEFGHAYLDRQPEEAKELGCDPDFNAWLNGKENIRPDANVSFRTGAGHVHIGLWDPKDRPTNHEAVAIELVKQLDFYLGLPSLLFDKDTQRRELYGRAGAFRLKPYGVEYRVLSNKWVSSKSLQRWVYRNTLDAIFQLKRGNHIAKKVGRIQRIINTSKIPEAVGIMDAFNIKAAPERPRRARYVG